jgi:hypothetical protein
MNISDTNSRLYLMRIVHNFDGTVASRALLEAEYRDWQVRPGLWGAQTRVRWNALLGIFTVASVSAAGWFGVVALVSRFVR